MMAMDNSAAIGIVTNTAVKQKWSKAIDMRFIGYSIAFDRDNLKSTGAKVKQIVPNIFPSIILRHTIKLSVPRTCTSLQILRKIILSVFPTDTATLPATTVPSAKSLTLHSVDPGEGVLLSLGNPLGNRGCPCDITSNITASHCQGHPYH